MGDSDRFQAEVLDETLQREYDEKICASYNRLIGELRAEYDERDCYIAANEFNCRNSDADVANGGIERRQYRPAYEVDGLARAVGENRGA